MMTAILSKTLFTVFSFIIAIADIKTGMIPRLAFILAFPVFLALGLLQNETFSILATLAGALLGLIVFLLAYFISRKRLGLADVWYSALIGLVLGPLWWYAAMGFACVIGIIYMFVSRQKKIPFIPLMALGSVTMEIIRTFF